MDIDFPADVLLTPVAKPKCHAGGCKADPLSYRIATWPFTPDKKAPRNRGRMNLLRASGLTPEKEHPIQPLLQDALTLFSPFATISGFRQEYLVIGILLNLRPWVGHVHWVLEIR